MENVTEAGKTFVVCHIGEFYFAIQAESIVEYLQSTEFMPLPALKDQVAGLTLFRGEPIPLLDISEFLPSSDGQTYKLDKMLVTQTEEGFVCGLRIENVIGLAEMSFTETQSSHDDENDYLSHIILGEGRAFERQVMIVQPEELLSTVSH